MEGIDTGFHSDVKSTDPLYSLSVVLPSKSLCSDLLNLKHSAPVDLGIKFGVPQIILWEQWQMASHIYIYMTHRATLLEGS